MTEGNPTRIKPYLLKYAVQRVVMGNIDIGVGPNHYGLFTVIPRKSPLHGFAPTRTSGNYFRATKEGREGLVAYLKNHHYEPDELPFDLPPEVPEHSKTLITRHNNDPMNNVVMQVAFRHWNDREKEQIVEQLRAALGGR